MTILFQNIPNHSACASLKDSPEKFVSSLSQSGSSFSPKGAQPYTIDDIMLKGTSSWRCRKWGQRRNSIKNNNNSTYDAKSGIILFFYSFFKV